MTDQYIRNRVSTAAAAPSGASIGAAATTSALLGEPRERELRLASPMC